jgi:peptidoglycan hydrolase-like protein with peptidoglycan-binding domain
MKQLLTLAAVALVSVAGTVTARAQQAAAAPQAAAEKPAAPAPAAKAVTVAKKEGTTAKAAAKPKFTAQQIKDVQTGLQKQKLYTGKISGVWSASTVKAYKAWQKANNLPEDGILTEDAIAKLKAAQ